MVEVRIGETFECTINGKKPYTVYKIELLFGNKHAAVFKRYSECRHFHQKLSQEEKISTPKFPSKKLIGSLNPSFVEKRRKELENYFNIVVNNEQFLHTKSIHKFFGIQRFSEMYPTKSMQNLKEQDNSSNDKETEGSEDVPRLNLEEVGVQDISTYLTMSVRSGGSNDSYTDSSEYLTTEGGDEYEYEYEYEYNRHEPEEWNDMVSHPPPPSNQGENNNSDSTSSTSNASLIKPQINIEQTEPCESSYSQNNDNNNYNNNDKNDNNVNHDQEEEEEFHHYRRRRGKSFRVTASIPSNADVSPSTTVHSSSNSTR